MPSCNIGEVSIGLQGRLVTKHNFVCENGAFCWPPPPNAAAAGQNGHVAAAAKFGSARRRRRPSGLETPPPTLKWSAHRSGSTFFDELSDIIGTVIDATTVPVLLCGDLNCPGAVSSEVDAQLVDVFTMFGLIQPVSYTHLTLPTIYSV